MRKIVAADNKVILSEKDFQLLVEYLKSIQFGSVTLIIRDNKVIGIEKNEKIRLE